MNANIINNSEDDSKELFSIIHIPWKNSESEIWKDFSTKIKSAPIIEMKPKTINWQGVAVAAVIVLFIGIAGFISTYTVTNTALNAQYSDVQLPDGSTINLNAESEISYKPYWWWANRQVELKGEAFFEVKKGKTFSVESNAGITEVLGTSFNIYSRNQRYEVTCVTGKVKVHATETEQSVIIHPNEKAILEKTGQFTIKENINTENTRAWLMQKMIFTSVSLKDVFQEIERQYNVDIKLRDELNYKYTGSLDKSETIEDILQLICRPFELTVTQKNNQYYIEK